MLQRGNKIRCSPCINTDAHSPADLITDETAKRYCWLRDRRNPHRICFAPALWKRRQRINAKAIKKKIVKKALSGQMQAELSRLKKSAEEKAFFNNRVALLFYQPLQPEAFFSTAIPRKTRLKSSNMRHTRYTTGFIRNSLLQERSVIKRQRRYSKRHTTQENRLYPCIMLLTVIMNSGNTKIH
jgi:hypothetical protein